MPQVHFVKRVRKDNQVCKKGESYFYWKFRYGPKRYSLTRPRPCQLTQSEFLSTVYDLNDRVEQVETKTREDFQEEVQSLADEYRTLGDEQQDKIYNMPDSLQQGPTGELLEQRAEDCANVAEQLEALSTEVEDDPDEGESKEEHLERILDNLHNIQYEGD